jgi:hypothetical protein
MSIVKKIILVASEDSPKKGHTLLSHLWLSDNRDLFTIR